MKIKKIGHCCFVAEPKLGVRVMTDPGAFSRAQTEERNISAVLITHEHQDHLHIESLKEVLINNPRAVVITNAAVGKLLEGANISYLKIEQGQTHSLGEVEITGFGNVHAEIYGSYGRVQNTGYMIDSLCYPGDAFESPDSKVDILALPVTGPWMRVKDAIDYARAIRPRAVFPVHDSHIHDWASFIWRVPESILKEDGINFKKLELEEEVNL